MMFKIMYVNNVNVFDLYAEFEIQKDTAANNTVLSTFILVIVTSFKAIAFIVITKIN